MEFVEVRADTWTDAAHQLTSAVAALGLKSGQLRSVDAHSNGQECPAIMTAYFATLEPPPGAPMLELKHHVLESTAEWPQLYYAAASFCQGLQVGSGQSLTDQLLSITCSCGSSTKAVCIFFDSAAGAVNDPVQLQYVHSESGSWNGAASDLLRQLHHSGVPSHSPLCLIDAHNDAPSASARFVAFFEAQSTDRADELMFTSQNSTDSWHDQSQKAVSLTSSFGVEPLAITSSCNQNGSGSN